MSGRSKWTKSVARLALVALVVGCSTAPGGEADADVEFSEPDVVDRDTEPADSGDADATSADTGDVGDQSCQISHELPPGDVFALYVDEIREPESVVSIAAPFMGDTPPMVMFVDGLIDGDDDTLDFVGGFGERTGLGDDETPDTNEDVYALYYGAISTDTCDYRVRLDGQTVEYEISGSAPSVELELDGVSSLTAGVIVDVEDVEAIGELSDDLLEISDLVLSGMLNDEGIDALVEAVQDQVPISADQARGILDPDGDGELPIEMVLSGRQVVADGFIDAEADRSIEARAEAGPCCPDELQIGDSVISYLKWEQQGIDERQGELLDTALPAFRDDPHVAMVTTARRQGDGSVQYEVYSGGAVDEGMIIFERSAGDGDAPEFEIVEQSGLNPLANTDPTALSSYEAFLEAGANPNAASYADRGYDEDDERLSFVPAHAMHYPFAMERVAQNFDDPRAGDLIVIPASWSTGGFGTHGQLGSLQSRTPLAVAGPGIRGADDAAQTEYADVESLSGGGETLLIDAAVRQVDIAPTVAAALGVEKTTGVGPDLRLRDDIYLGWQDGRVLEEIFTDDALAAIEDGEPVAERALIIVNDGLTNPELFYQAFSGDEAVETGAYQQHLAAGLAYRHGAISNFPSNSFPGHNTIGAGVWSGHHGVVDNSFWEREQGAAGSPRGEVFDTEYLFGSAHPNLPVETLHEAVTRTFGGLDDSILAASINNPSTRGAQLATFEGRRPGGFEVSQEGEEVPVGDETFGLPTSEIDEQIEVMDNSSAQAFAALYQDHVNRGDDGLPVPKYAILNLGATDTEGHRHGPHGDEFRQGGLPRTNQRLEVIFAVLDSLDLLESTLVVLTADHGMEMQDQSRSSSRTAALDEAGVSFRSAGWHIYFQELAVDVQDVAENGEEVTFSLRVVDRATMSADEPIGVEHVQVGVVEGGVAQPAETDRDGFAEVAVTVEDDEDVVLEFDHGQWNAHREHLELP